MFEDIVIIENEENNQRSCDYICYVIESFLIFSLIFVLVYFVWFLFKMIETMTFKIKYT
jgi:hypothetical protein